MASGYRHYAGVAGSKEIWVGKDADIYNYTSVATAVAAAQPGDEVHVTSGTYTETAVVALAQSMSLIGHGDVTITSGLAATCTANVPAAGSSAVNINVSNIKFISTLAAGDALNIAQLGGSSGILTTVWDKCGFTGGATGQSVTILGNHASTTCFHYFYGARHLDLSPDMGVDLDIAASECHVAGYQLDGGETFALGDSGTAWILSIDNVIYSSTALFTTGGGSAIVNLTSCSKIASAAIVAPVVEDMDDATADVNLQSGVLDT